MAEPKTFLVVPKANKCNARCRFCVTSGIQGLPGYEERREEKIDPKRLKKAIIFSKGIGAADSNITGGTEPTLYDPSGLGKITSFLSDNFGRVNMYTNGSKLLEVMENSKTLFSYLSDLGLTNTVISRAHYDDEKNSEVMGLPRYNLKKIADEAGRHNVSLKLSCLLTKSYVGSPQEVLNYIDAAGSCGIDKIIFRELLSVNDNSPHGRWVRDNYVPVSVVSGKLEECGFKSYEGLWGQIIWDCDGVGVTIWPDGTRKDTVNKGDLIYMPDNKLYSHWVHKHSRIM